MGRCRGRLLNSSAMDEREKTVSLRLINWSADLKRWGSIVSQSISTGTKSGVLERGKSYRSPDPDYVFVVAVEEEDWPDGGLRLWIEEVGYEDDPREGEPIYCAGPGFINEHGKIEKIKNKVYSGPFFKTGQKMWDYLETLPVLPERLL